MKAGFTEVRGDLGHEFGRYSYALFLSPRSSFFFKARKHVGLRVCSDKARALRRLPLSPLWVMLRP